MMDRVIESYDTPILRFPHHTSRNPKITGRRHCKVDFRNNVIYNWGFNSCYDGTASHVNWANNYYKAGPGTKADVRGRIFELEDNPIPPGGVNRPEDSEKYETSLYAEGNLVHGHPTITADNWNGGIAFAQGATEAKNRAKRPFAYPAISEQTAEAAYPLVVSKTGASLVRDAIDSRIANEVLSGTAVFGNKGHVDSPSDVGGWPRYESAKASEDKDRDGMADAWEATNGLNPIKPSDRNGYDLSSEYTNLEVYLDWLHNGRRSPQASALGLSF